MKLPNLPLLSKKEKPEFFLSLIFRTDKLEAFIFEKLGETMKVVSSTEETFNDSLESAGFEEILDVADKAITQAEDEANLPDEVVKTIFGLKDTWVVDNKIKKEQLDVLKKLCDSLGLTPVGFLTIPEAVVSLLQKEEGAPPSAILVDVSKNQISVSLVKAGKVIESKTSEIHQSPVFTVDTLLKHFETMEILPSRVILLNEDEDLVQEFLNHQWSKSLPFLHLPQTSNLPEGFLGKSLILGIANQFNAKIIDEFGIEPKVKKEEAEKPIEQAVVEPAVSAQPEPSGEQKVEELGDAAGYFGFAKDKDVAKAPSFKVEEKFADKREEVVTEEIPEDVKLKEEGTQIFPSAVFLVIPKIKNLFAKAKARIKNSNVKLPSTAGIPNLPFGGKKLLMVLLPVIFLLLITIYYFLGLKAIVVLSVKPNVVEKNQDITFSTSSDFKNNVIKGDLISQDEDGSSSTPATGKKDTGDLAKGTVTIFNLTSNTITYPSQTTITSFNSLNFLTDSTVTVASSSGDASNPSPGKINVNVTAGKFGTEYNMPQGTKFSIGSASTGSIVAKNDNPFSGGTKKTINVVSKDDVAKLESDLEKQLEDKAKSDITSKLGSSKDILSSFVNENISSESLDKKVDDEASTVGIKATVIYQTVSYDKSEFNNYLKSIFGSNNSVDLKNIELSFSNIKTKNGNTTATVNIKAKTFPQIDITDLAKKIGGKSFTFASNMLSNLPQVSNVNIRFSPNIPLLPKVLPRIPKNIIFQVLENG